MLSSSVFVDVPKDNPCKALFEGTRCRLFDNTKYIVLGGGAVYGIMYIGVLMELCRFSKTKFASWMSKLRGVAGTSAGTVVGIMLAAGMDPWDMRNVLHKSGLHRVLESFTFTSSSLNMNSSDKVDDVAKDLVISVTGRVDTTFAEFYAKTKREFVIVVTNGKTSMAEFWSYKNKPNIELWRAIRCSTSVPGLFTSPVIDDTTYFDGGVTCNLACHLFPPKLTLSLFVHSKFKQPCYANIVETILHSLTVYMSIAQLGPMRMSAALASRAIPCVVHKANTGLFGPFAFDATPDMYDALIDDGARCARGLMMRDTLLCCMLMLRLLPRTYIYSGDFGSRKKQTLIHSNRNAEP